MVLSAVLWIRIDFSQFFGSGSRRAKKPQKRDKFMFCSAGCSVNFLDPDPEGQKNHKKEINLCFVVLGVLC
jgi:hypothetical protein